MKLIGFQQLFIQYNLECLGDRWVYNVYVGTFIHTYITSIFINTIFIFFIITTLIKFIDKSSVYSKLWDIQI